MTESKRTFSCKQDLFLSLGLSLALSAGAHPSAHAMIPVAPLSGSAQTRSASLVVNALNRELGGMLTPEQTAQIESLEAQMHEERARPTVAAFSPEFHNVSLLICASARGAAIVKGRLGACSSLGGTLYQLVGYGAGTSVGVQLSLFGLAIVSPPGVASISGVYSAATTMSQSGLGFVVRNIFPAAAWRIELNALMRFLFVFGGPDVAVAQSTDSHLFLAGVGVGPMFDLGLEWLKLSEIQGRTFSSVLLSANVPRS